MDSSESTKMVYDRIQKLEPELASKIVGFLLFHESDNRQMIRLAFSPDNVILSITNRVKTELGFMSSNPQNPHMQQSSLVDFSSKICQYCTNGFCKHGLNCRFIHGNLNEGVIWDQLFSSGSLKMLEMELTSLLRSRNGAPISISLLPVLYRYMFGKALICKAGFTLVELLARMTNTIRLLEIAHGHHVLILTEDLPKYMAYKNELIEHGGSAARQIYLTFPAESTFTEQEVRYHFNGFGPVEDVRMPFQQKRMFGFVTFVFPETVRMILARGNPHFIYGARVLVKPYKEKQRPDHKKKSNKKEPIHMGLQSFDGGSKSPAVSRTPNGNKRRVRKNVMEEHEVELETERRRISEFQLAPNRMSNDHSNGYGKKAELTDSVSEMDPPAKKELDA